MNFKLNDKVIVQQKKWMNYANFNPINGKLKYWSKFFRKGLKGKVINTLEHQGLDMIEIKVRTKTYVVSSSILKLLHRESGHHPNTNIFQ